MSRPTTSIRAEGILLFTTLLWGGTFTVTKIGLGSVPPFMMIGLRFGVAFVVFAAVTAKRFATASTSDLIRGSVLGLLMLAGYGLQTAGLELTTVAKSSLFTYTFAIYVPPLQFLILRKKLKIGTAIGILLSLVGVFIFSAPDRTAFNIGDVFTLLSAFAFGWQIVILDIYTRKSDPVKLTAVQFAVVAIGGFIIAGATGTLTVDWSLQLAGSIGYLAVAGSVVAIYLMNRYQRDTTPSKAVVIYAMEPVFSVAIGVVVLGELFGYRELIGGLFIIAGVLISELWSSFTQRRST